MISTLSSVPPPPILLNVTIQAMNHDNTLSSADPAESSNGPLQPVTASICLGWQVDAVILQGKAGWRYHIRHEDYIHMYALNIEARPAIGETALDYDQDLDMDTVLGDSIRCIKRLTWLRRMLRNHRSRRQEALELAKEMLIARGLETKQFAKMQADTIIHNLADNIFPPNTESSGFKLELCILPNVDSTTLTHQELFIHYCCDFDTLIWILREATLDTANRFGHASGFSIANGEWRFRLLSKRMTVVSGYRPLSTQKQFQEMMRCVQTKETPSVMLFHVSQPLNISD